MPRTLSAGLLLYRRTPALQLLIAHLGGPFWARKDERAWSIPKGEYLDSEDPFAAAQREFAEELGAPAPALEYLQLGSTRLSSGKHITVWAGESDFDISRVRSNTFELVWPPRSGRLQSFPEIDRAEWVRPDLARSKLVASQVVFVERLVALLSDTGG
jgi:predicted NUDIX family NTP pyrophosphohydrolase